MTSVELQEALALAQRLPALNVNAYVIPESLLLARVLLCVHAELIETRKTLVEITDAMADWRRVARNHGAPRNALETYRHGRAAKESP